MIGRDKNWLIHWASPWKGIDVPQENFGLIITTVTGPHFSPAFYCGGGSGYVYRVALLRAPRRTVEYACGALGRAPCIHARLRRLAKKPGEKCGLSITKESLPR